MPDSVELRKRAEWYREFAERAGTPWVWEARLKTAKQLEAEAVRVELETRGAMTSLRPYILWASQTSGMLPRLHVLQIPDTTPSICYIVATGDKSVRAT